MSRLTAVHRPPGDFWKNFRKTNFNAKEE